MFYRRLSVAIASGLVGYGAWMGYRGNNTDAASALTKGYSSGKQSGQDPMTRNVLVIGADEIHSGTFVGDGPISKTTDSDGRKVVEMLTPDQATQMLRKSEQSYFVNRGQGVVRYDLVQLPSNDPIEDDHAEKIVEFNNGATAKSDWMFWGVFDGHSFVAHDSGVLTTIDRFLGAGQHLPSFDSR
jgi:pyruvate dehydrogenase phosphatase